MSISDELAKELAPELGAEQALSLASEIVSMAESDGGPEVTSLESQPFEGEAPTQPLPAGDDSPSEPIESAQPVAAEDAAGEQAPAESGPAAEIVEHVPADVEAPAPTTDAEISQAPVLVEAWRLHVLPGAIEALVVQLAAAEVQIELVQRLAGPDCALLNGNFADMLKALGDRSRSIRQRRPIAIKQTKLDDDGGNLIIIRPARYAPKDQARQRRARPSQQTEPKADQNAQEASSDTQPSPDGQADGSEPEGSATGQPSSETKAKKRVRRKTPAKGRSKTKRRGKPDTAAAIFDRVAGSPENSPLPKLDDFDTSVYEDHPGYLQLLRIGGFADDETTRLLHYLLSRMGVARLHRYQQSAMPDKRQRLTLTLTHLEAMGIENIATLMCHTAAELLKPIEIGVNKTDKFGNQCLTLVRNWLHAVGTSLAGETWAEVDAEIKTSMKKK